MFRNTFKTVILLAGIGALFMVVGSFFGPGWVFVGLLLGLVFVGHAGLVAGARRG
jgi:hypothetical protein